MADIFQILVEISIRLWQKWQHTAFRRKIHLRLNQIWYQQICPRSLLNLSPRENAFLALLPDFLTEFYKILFFWPKIILVFSLKKNKFRKILPLFLAIVLQCALVCASVHFCALACYLSAAFFENLFFLAKNNNKKKGRKKVNFRKKSSNFP